MITRLWGVILLVISHSTFSQQFHFINYSLEDGLSQSQVTSIAQDGEGYMWFGTFGGANRFDGRVFKTYTIDNGLLDNEINQVYIDNLGVAWIATKGGISKFTGKGFSSIMLPKGHENTQVAAITQDDSNTFWIATTQGVFKLQNEVFKPISTSAQNIRHIVQCKDGIIRIGTPEGIEALDGNRFIKDTLTLGLNVSMVISNKPNEYWATTLGQGLIFVHGNTIKQYTKSDGLISDNIRCGIFDAEGVMWLCAKNGLSEFDGAKFQNMNQDDGFGSNDLRSVFFDTESNLWIGTGGKGILRFTGKAFVTYTTSSGIGSDIVMGAMQDHSNNLWFGTYDQGISKYENGKFYNYSTSAGLSNSRVWAEAIDYNGNLWIATSSGINKISANGIQVFSSTDGLTSKKATSILVSSDSTIWFGTKSGITAYKNGLFIPYPSGYGTIGNNVRALLEDAQGNIWAGCETGLFKFENNIWKPILSVQSGLNANTIYSLEQDKQGTIWIGTENGLHAYNDSNCSIIELDETFGASFIAFLITSSDNKLWAGTSNGLYSINLNDYYSSNVVSIDHYTKADGLASLECNQNSAFIDNNGKLWFGTSDGLTRLNLESLNTEPESYTPKIHLTDIKLFARSTNWHEYTDTINDWSGLPEHLTVPYRKNHFTFSFTGIYHSNPNNIEYMYMLVGFDEDWLPVTNANFATYSNLPHGSFTFQVIAGNGNGIWSAVPATFSFEILPPFWLTWWFYLSCFLLLTFCGIAAVYWRRKVRIRKETTMQLHYQSKMLALEQQTLNASMNRHFIFNALNSIQYYINRQDKLSANRYLSSFAKLVRKNLDSSSSGNMVPLGEEIERLKLYLNLEHMRFQDKFEYTIDADDNLNLQAIEVPAMLLQPFVENSIWHGILPKGESGVINISLTKKTDDTLQIRIQDDGVGIEQSKLNKQIEQGDHISKGMDITTNRLKLLKEMTNRNIYVNGPYELKHDNGTVSGTAVEIVLPINSKPQ